MKRLVLVGTLAIVGCANGLLSGDEAKTDAGSNPPTDASTSADGATLGDGGDCKADLEQPWQGAGVTTGYMNQSVLTLVSGDRYWTYDYASGAWGTSGHLETLWAAAPPVDGLLPWQDVGVHAAYVDGTTQTIVSADRYWTVDTTTGAWGTTGHVVTLWSAAPSNAGFEPWDAPGVQTAYPYQSGLTIISSDRYWILNLTNSTWSDGALETAWTGAPKVDSNLPWEGAGVSASWIYNDVQTILSSDRYWIANATNGTWTDTGHLETVWATAPAVDGCR